MTNPLAKQIAADLRIIAVAVDSYLNGLEDKKPAAGSHASLARQSKYGKLRGGEALNLIHTEIWMTVGIPSDHLHAAHRLIVQGDDVGVQRYAVLSVLRVALEVSSLAWWLADPRIKVRERVTRGLRLAAFSRASREKADKLIAIQDKDLEPLMAAQELIEGLARDLEIHAITSRLDENREVKIPDAVDLVRMQFEGIPSGDPDAAVSVYGVLSEPMHGNIFGSSSGYRRPTSEDAIQELHPKVPLVDIAIGANYATGALNYAIKAFIQWMGWDMDRWDDLANESLVRIQGAAEIVKQVESSH